MTAVTAKVPERALSGARIKGLVILATLVLSGGVFLSWSQNWLTLTITASAGTETTVLVDGSVAAPALSALGLAGLALAAALAIAGPVIRIVLAILQAVLGGCIALSGMGPLGDPVAAGSPRVTETTGIAGIESVRSITVEVVEGPWAILTVVLGILLVGVAVTILCTSARWPSSGRRYQAVRFETEGGETVDSLADLQGFDGADADAAADTDTDTDTDGAGSAATASDTSDTAAPQSAVDIQTAKRATAVDNWDSLTQGQDPTA